MFVPEMSTEHLSQLPCKKVILTIKSQHGQNRSTQAAGAHRCRAIMAHARQSRPNSSFGLKIKKIQTFEVVPSTLQISTDGTVPAAGTLGPEAGRCAPEAGPGAEFPAGSSSKWKEQPSPLATSCIVFGPFQRVCTTERDSANDRVCKSERERARASVWSRERVSE